MPFLPYKVKKVHRQWAHTYCEVEFCVCIVMHMPLIRWCRIFQELKAKILEKLWCKSGTFNKSLIWVYSFVIACTPGLRKAPHMQLTKYLHMFNVKPLKKVYNYIPIFVFSFVNYLHWVLTILELEKCPAKVSNSVKRVIYNKCISHDCITDI